MAATAAEWISGTVTPGQMVSSWSYNLIYHCVPLQLDDATDTWLELNSPILISRNYQRLFQGTGWRNSTIPIMRMCQSWGGQRCATRLHSWPVSFSLTCLCCTLLDVTVSILQCHLLFMIVLWALNVPLKWLQCIYIVCHIFVLHFHVETVFNFWLCCSMENFMTHTQYSQNFIFHLSLFFFNVDASFCWRRACFKP